MWAEYSVAIPVRLLVFAALLGLPAAQVHGATSPLTPEEQQALIAYGELPAFEHLTISPDGTRLAYIGTVGTERHMVVKSLADGRKLADFTANKGQKLRAWWAGNDHTTAMSTTPNLRGAADRDDISASSPPTSGPAGPTLLRPWRANKRHQCGFGRGDAVGGNWPL
jgi:hypothetical protein